MTASAVGRLELDGSPRLSGPVNLESVSRLITSADSLFDSGSGKCTIDLGGLDDSDSATVALLLEWKRRAAGRGCSLSFTSIPTRLTDIARISQLDSLLAS